MAKLEPMTIEVQIDIDKHLMGDPIYDEYGEIVDSGQTTLEDIVLDQVVYKLVSNAINNKYEERLAQRVKDIRDETIRDIIAPIIEATINKSLQPTDNYGNPKGDPVTLAGLIEQRAKEYLVEKEPVPYHSNKKPQTKIELFIESAVNNEIKKELHQALEDGKKEVKEAVQQKGAEVIQEAISRMAKQ